MGMQKCDTKQQWVNGSIMISLRCSECSEWLLLFGADGEMEHLNRIDRGEINNFLFSI